MQGTVQAIFVTEGSILVKIKRPSGTTTLVLWSPTANPDVSPLLIGARMTLLSNALINGNTVLIWKEMGLITQIYM